MASRALTRLRWPSRLAESATPIKSANGAILFEVSERKHFLSTEFESGKATSKAQARSEQVNLLMGSWIQSRLSDLEVRYSQQMVDQFDLQAQLGGADS